MPSTTKDNNSNPNPSGASDGAACVRSVGIEVKAGVTHARAHDNVAKAEAEGFEVALAAEAHKGIDADRSGRRMVNVVLKGVGALTATGGTPQSIGAVVVRDGTTTLADLRKAVTAAQLSTSTNFATRACIQARCTDVPFSLNEVPGTAQNEAFPGDMSEQVVPMPADGWAEPPRRIADGSGGERSARR